MMAQFSHVNPYRWPGWFITALALVAAIIVLLCFSEPRSWTCGKGSINCSCITGLRLSAQLKSKTKIRFIVSFFLVHCYNDIIFLLPVWLSFFNCTDICFFDLICLCNWTNVFDN